MVKKIVNFNLDNCSISVLMSTKEIFGLQNTKSKFIRIDNHIINLDKVNFIEITGEVDSE